MTRIALVLAALIPLTVGCVSAADLQEVDAAASIQPIEIVETPALEEAPVEETLAAPFEEGEASYYGAELAGNPTASGEIFDPSAMTAAHPTLPLGTELRVTNLANGRTVDVRINDRGPFAKSRIIDLSHGAADAIGMVASGTARVQLQRL